MLTPLALMQIVLMGLIESYRANGGIDDDLGLDRLYPGGDYFDPLGLADDPDSFAELRVNNVSWHIACTLFLNNVSVLQFLHVVLTNNPFGPESNCCKDRGDSETVTCCTNWVPTTSCCELFCR